MFGEAHPPVDYAEYLQLQTLLSAQKPISKDHRRHSHDEHLFIIVHQVNELWFSQVLQELRVVVPLFFHSDSLDERAFSVAVQRLERCLTIFRAMPGTFDILETMTPMDFLEFRDLLTPASGFQSAQFRQIERLLGLSKHKRMTIPGVIDFSEADLVENLATGMTRWLERTPFLSTGDFDFASELDLAFQKVLHVERTCLEGREDLSPEALHRETQRIEALAQNMRTLVTRGHDSQDRIAGNVLFTQKAHLGALFIFLYRDWPALELPYRFLRTLIDIDEAIAAWRSRHARMAERMIGLKMGTGGTSGHDYLRATVDRNRLYPELTQMASYILPRFWLPELPESVKKLCSYQYQTVSSS